MSDLSTIFREGVLVQLSISRWGFSARKIPKELMEKMGAKSKWVSGFKNLINKENLKPVSTPANKATVLLNTYALPFPIRGIHFVPKMLITKIDELFTECKEEFEEAVEEFAEEYEEYVEEAKEELGDELFDPNQYPTRIRDHFSFSWQFFTLDVPSGDLGVLSPQQYEAEMEKMRGTILNARDMAVEALRKQLLDIVKGTVDKLRDGDAKRFHTSMITRFKDFFSTFADRNVFGDKKLAELVEVCREAMDGVEIEDIRTEDEFREELAEELDDVKDELEKAIIRKPTRKIHKRIIPNGKITVRIKVKR